MGTFKKISRMVVYIFKIKLECCLISAVKEYEKNKERKSKDYGRSKAKKKKKKKKRAKPGKAFFSLEENGFVSLFCLLPSSMLLRGDIADISYHIIVDMFPSFT